MPAGTSIQSLAPREGLYHPGAHLLQTVRLLPPKILEAVPKPHKIQTELFKASNCSLYLPTGHEVHTLNPVCSAYVPAEQTEQESELT